jgi:hypothetical protein
MESKKKKKTRKGGGASIYLEDPIRVPKSHFLNAEELREVAVYIGGVATSDKS